MKRKWIVLGIALTAMLGETALASETLSETLQQKRIVSAVESWKPGKNKGNYTVTDLDQNGRLEIISADYSKEDQITVSHIWEVDEEGKLQKIETSWSEEESQPDLITKSTKVWYDEEDDVYYYLFTDQEKLEDGSERERKMTISLKDGQLSTVLLAEKTTDEAGTETFADADGNEITAADYENAAETIYGELKEKEAKFKWINTKEHAIGSDVPMEQLLELVSEANAGFSVRDPE